MKQFISMSYRDDKTDPDRAFEVERIWSTDEKKIKYRLNLEGTTICLDEGQWQFLMNAGEALSENF